jgi:hypothetical protein
MISATARPPSGVHNHKKQTTIFQFLAKISFIEKKNLHIQQYR